MDEIAPHFLLIINLLGAAGKNNLVMCMSENEFHKLIASLLDGENCRAEWTINEDQSCEKSVGIVAKITLKIDQNATEVTVKTSTEDSKPKIETAVLAINDKILEKINNLVDSVEL